MYLILTPFDTAFIGDFHLFSLASGKPCELTAIKAELYIKDALDLVSKLNPEKNCFLKTLTFVSETFGNNTFMADFH